MRALILSGGATRGSMQVGALRALLERGFSFDMIVGVSIGAMNGIYFATKPTLEGVKELEDIWLSMKREHIFPQGRLQALARLVRNRVSLFSNEALHRFVLKAVSVRKFGELKLPTYIPAVDVKTGEVYVFGDDPLDPIVDAVMASTALPPYFPPWKYKNMLLIDGGFYSNIPYKIAVDRGAKSVVSLHILGGRSFDDEVYNLYWVFSRSVGILLEARVREQERFAKEKHVRTLYIPLDPPYNISIFDFSKTKELIEAGYYQTVQVLEREKQKGFWDRTKDWVKALLR